MTTHLEELVQATSQQLLQQGLKLATAESCTGGGLSYWLTMLSGSSNWFECGFVTYSDAAKVAMLGVSPGTLTTYGAVSEQTVREMAEGARLLSRADVSIAITGIAGPTGGSKQKPVGNVWIAWARPDMPTQVHEEIFPGDRQTIRTQTMERALEKLVALLKA